MEEYRLIMQDWLRSRDLQIVMLACLAICFAGMGAVDIWENKYLTYWRKSFGMGLMGVLILMCLDVIIMVVGR